MPVAPIGAAGSFGRRATSAAFDVKFVSFDFTIEAAGIDHNIVVPWIEAAYIDRGNQ
jgi:hypothetical protein